MRGELWFAVGTVERRVIYRKMRRGGLDNS
jgi:hypothetical protein